MFFGLSSVRNASNSHRFTNLPIYLTSSANPEVASQNDLIKCIDIWAIRLINAHTFVSFYKSISAFRKAGEHKYTVLAYFCATSTSFTKGWSQKGKSY